MGGLGLCVIFSLTSARSWISLGWSTCDEGVWSWPRGILRWSGLGLMPTTWSTSSGQGVWSCDEDGSFHWCLISLMTASGAIGRCVHECSTCQKLNCIIAIKYTFQSILFLSRRSSSFEDEATKLIVIGWRPISPTPTPSPIRPDRKPQEAPRTAEQYTMVCFMA